VNFPDAFERLTRRENAACFENYPNYRVHDANFGAYEKAHDWLAAYDLYTTGLWQDREYAIMPYLSYTLAAFHPLFATKGGPKLERPHMDWEVGLSDHLWVGT
jgi:chromosome transmission fidelity protein 18